MKLNDRNEVSEVLLPPQGDLRKQLELKLKEYSNRCSACRQRPKYPHPELLKTLEQEEKHAHYKHLILWRVLELKEGEQLLFQELKADLEETEGFDVQKFLNAYGVIAGYLGVTTLPNEGGTGLPALAEEAV